MSTVWTDEDDPWGAYRPDAPSPVDKALHRILDDFEPRYRRQGDRHLWPDEEKDVDYVDLRFAGRTCAWCGADGHAEHGCPETPMEA